MNRPDETDRLTALNGLMAVIHVHVEHGEPVPCVDPAIGHRWTAEDREQLEAAGHACQTCPALAACARYVDQFPEPSGVWAGRVPRINPRKTETASEQATRIAGAA